MFDSTFNSMFDGIRNSVLNSVVNSMSNSIHAPNKCPNARLNACWNTCLSTGRSPIAVRLMLVIFSFSFFFRTWGMFGMKVKVVWAESQSGVG